MSMRFRFATTFLLLAFGGLYAGGQEPMPRDQAPAPPPVFVRLTLYPTASLSRYDYNNDLDLFEVRVYAEVRLRSPVGRPVTDADITVMSQRLDLKTDHYEKRIVVDKDALPDQADFEIAIGGRTVFRETIPIPDWLVLSEPRPAILESGQDLLIRWRFIRFSAPVGVNVYDFRKGGDLFKQEESGETEITIPGDKVPAETILRIFVMTSWFSKRFLHGEGLVRGSEVNVIPWSQVFLRTK